MTRPSSEKKEKEGEVCYWCGRSLQPEVRQRRPVCSRCYRLLIGAGIKDKEIFGEEEADAEGDGDD